MEHDTPPPEWTKSEAEFSTKAYEKVRTKTILESLTAFLMPEWLFKSPKPLFQDISKASKRINATLRKSDTKAEKTALKMTDDVERLALKMEAEARSAGRVQGNDQTFSSPMKDTGEFKV